jgi:hypothetical protein
MQLNLCEFTSAISEMKHADTTFCFFFNIMHCARKEVGKKRMTVKNIKNKEIKMEKC